MNIFYPRIIQRPPQFNNMSTSRLVRGTKSRFFLYVCAFTAFLLVIYVFHGSQQQIEESQKSAAMCLQQQETLTAQLQVIFEYKLRLEKALEKEKADHKTTNEECQSRVQEEKTEREKENMEAQKKYNALEQHHKLLLSQHEDLTEDCSKVRKERLEGIEEKSRLEKLISAVKLEVKQISEAKDKSLEALKSKYTQLEIEKERLQHENVDLRKSNMPESEKVNLLEKRNAQLLAEISELKKKLINCSGDQIYKEQKKSSISSVNLDQSFGMEPPKVNPLGTNLSTTPVINPEAVIEHDVSIKPATSKNSQLTPSSRVTANLKPPTQSAALPIQIPANQENDNMRDVKAPFNFEGNKHPIEDEREPLPIPQLPETNVINKPDLQEDQKKDDLNEENQGGEVVQDVPGPMNPIQDNENAPNMAPFHKYLENKRWNIDKDNQGFVGRKPDVNGAHEEGDEEVAPVPLHPNWRLDDKLIPRQIKHDYQGGDYDKEPPEEEEDEEGEQLDYIAAEPGLKQAKQMSKLRQQFDSNRARVMVNPK
uniref:Golgi integral membrane protein 4 n=2 Tax=Clastoptera arizonana TaxID=38151 RepID=A0A1B6DB24_9HEMI